MKSNLVPLLRELAASEELADAAADRIEELEDREKKLRLMVEILWDIIDDIDTYGDMAKSDDAMYRKMVEARQKQRWVATGITCNGHELDLHIS